MKSIALKVWDPFVRVFHWTLVAFFLINFLFTEAEGALHEWLGYAVLVLIGLRIIWGIVGPTRARFSAFPPSVEASLSHLKEISRGIARPHDSHSPLGALMIYNLLVTIVLIGITGYMITVKTYVGGGWLEELHESLANWAMISVFVHVGAVILESRRLQVNLVKSMWRGYKDGTEKEQG